MQAKDSSLQTPRAKSSDWSPEPGSSSHLPCVPRKCAVRSFPWEVKQDTHLLCAGPSVRTVSLPLWTQTNPCSSPLHPGVSGDVLRPGVHDLAGFLLLVPSWSGTLNLPSVGSRILGFLCGPYLALIQGMLYRTSRWERHLDHSCDRLSHRGLVFSWVVSMRSRNGAVGYEKPITNLLSFVAVFRVLVLAVLDKYCTKELTPQPSACACMSACVCPALSPA